MDKPDSPTTSHNSQSVQQSALISLLPGDVLHHIFCEVTDVAFETEHTNTVFMHVLRSSHVCSDWRRIILASPILWSRVVDLRCLRHREWREEVVRRTGSARLNFTAYTSMRRHSGGAETESFEVEEVIISFLECNWQRIRFLDVYFDNPEGWMSVAARVWDVLERPSPVLESFRFRIPNREGAQTDSEGLTGVNLPEGHRLFRDQVPVLKEWNASIRINFKSPWFRQIGALSICGALPVNELLEALSAMPLLRDLRDERNSIVPATGKLPSNKIRLPRLRDLAIYSNGSHLPAYQDFIENLSVLSCSRCHLRISIRPSTPLLEGKIFRRLASSFAKFCSMSSASGIHISTSQTRISFAATLPSSSQATFTIDVAKAPLAMLPLSFSEHLFRRLNRLVPLNCVREASLSIHYNARYQFNETRAAEQLISWLASATTLKISGNALMILSVHNHTHYTPARVPFISLPGLEALKLTSYPRTTEMPYIETFLYSRVSLGRPIERLSIEVTKDQANEMNNILATDLKWLKAFSGMKVRTFVKRLPGD